MSPHRLRTRTLIVASTVVTVALMVAGCSSSDDDGAANSSTTASSGSSPASTNLAVEWTDGYQSPGTPAQYNKVGVLKVGDREAPNVLVLEPGTSAGSAYFVPLAEDIVKADPSWQIWSIERR
ncbi:MAG: hypothetical protein ACHQDC_01100, partial [Acidimicrobiales bacterium]